MKITVLQDAVVEPEITIRCNNPDAVEIQLLVRMLKGGNKKIPAQQTDALTYLEPSEVLYGEFVGRGVFIYTKDAVLPTTVTLGQLEQNYPGFLRCSKSMVVNLYCIQKLKSEVSGRILATLSNNEQILISRHYASALRGALANKY